MASNINPGNIDGEFPVAGIDNDSQSFRTNFTNTSTNFTSAKDEIEDLQAKTILKAPLSGENSVDNDMLGEVIKSVNLLDSRETVFSHSSLAGAVVIDHQNGHYQTLTTTGSITLSFSNFPSTTLGRVRVEMTIADLSHTVTLPSDVSEGVEYIAGYVSAGSIGADPGTITFTSTGTFVFEFYSVDNTTFAANDLTRQGGTAAQGELADTALQPSDIGVTVQAAGVPHFKSYSATALNVGTAYVGGFYEAPASDSTLTIGGTVIETLSASGKSHAAHAFVVASGPGGTDLVLTVSGTSITDTGVRTLGDSEVVVADTDAASTNEYFETTKKWLGEVTFTLTGSAGSFTFNYGLVKYEDFGNRDFEVTDFEVTGRAEANETDLNIELLLHDATSFVYSAGAFVPNETPLVSLANDHATDNNVDTGEHFAYKRAALPGVPVSGTLSEGVIIRVSTAVDNSISYMNFHLGITYT